MAICTVCGCAYLPRGRWREDWCSGCAVNFAASEEPRLDDAPVPEAVPPTHRQVETMRRMAVRWFAANEEED
jgi:hypothetical protein